MKPQVLTYFISASNISSSLSRLTKVMLHAAVVSNDYPSLPYRLASLALSLPILAEALSEVNVT
jgi:hypothetical protein